MRAADSKLALLVTWFATRAAGAVSERLAAPFAYRLWFTPWRVDPGERGRRRQSEWLKGTKPAGFHVAGRHLSGFTAGSGPVVVLVHGWGERAASLGAFVQPLVDAGYTVVGVDLPGHGASPGGRVNAFELADALRGVCESFGEVHSVIAHSMGGMTALVAAGGGMPAKSIVAIAPASRIDRAMEQFTAIFSMPPKAVAGLRRLIGKRFGTDVWDRLSCRDIAASLDLPALIVHDRDDPQVACADSVELAASWPGARIITTEGLGHVRILRDQKVIAEVLSFLGGIGVTRTRLLTTSKA